MPSNLEETRKKFGPSDSEHSLIKERNRLIKQTEQLRKRLGDQQLLIDQITERVESIGTLPKINKAPKIVHKNKVYSRPLVAMLNVADPHMEEVVDASETEGLAEWNFDKFLNCTWYLAKKTIDLVNIMRAKHSIDILHINWLGDMVTGEIHSDVYHTNAFYLPDALTLGPWFWSQFVRELSAHFEIVINTCIPGNHGRMDIKPSSKRFVGRNWDTAMYQNTAVLTRELENVEWRIPRSPKCVVEANGWYFLLQHGDQVAMHGGTIPYYGMARQRSAEIAKRLGYRVRDVEKQLNAGLLFDYDVRGHLHRFGTTDERTLLCPSMMGSNEWALSKSFSHSYPGARLFFVDEEHGLAGDWRINLVDLPGGHEFEPLPNWIA